MTARAAQGLFTALVAGLLLLLAVPAQADSTPLWDVDLEVQPDGDLLVTETIQQTFDVRRRGIFRYIPVTERLAPDGLVTVPDGDTDDWFQRIRITDIGVSSATAPTEVEVERPSRHDPSGQVSIRIGEEDTFITGTHEYRITYRVVGVMLDTGDESLLRWDAVGDGWQQPIGRVQVTVRGPGIRTDQAVCALAAGVVTTTCEVVEAGDDLFRAATTGITVGAPVSVSVPFDSASVAPSEPILQRRFTLVGAFVGDSRSIPIAVVLTLLLGAVTARQLHRGGRDRVARGDVTVDGRLDTTNDQDGRARPLFGTRAIPVQFTPPDDLRPGQLGLILDERIDPVEISATIVDLAVRGHLTIEEQSSKTLWWTNTDWTLHLRPPPPDDVVLPWERTLLDGLFDDRASVAVSDLKGTFHATYSGVDKALYEDGQARRWFADRPDTVRSRWLGLGIVVAFLGLAATGFAMYFSRMALATLPVIAVGLVIAVAHRHMPRRTPTGSRLLVQTLGFRHFIETAETDRAQFAEREHLFPAYLPYAVVFGATEQWARAFAGLGVLSAAGGVGAWYVGSGTFDAASFSSGMSSFSSTVGTAAATAPPSSSGGSGGFSGGGGFGGGGGGSW